MVDLIASYNKAGTKCRSYGMSLYNVDAPEDRKVLLDFSNTRFAPSSWDVLYVEGRTNQSCSVVTNKEGLFDVSSDQCLEKYYYYCQFTRTPTVVTPSKRREKIKINNLINLIFRSSQHRCLQRKARS
jgi:hypothetical protein